MAVSKRRIDRILETKYLEDLPSRSTDEIRAMRAECAEEESVFSYERRLLHGRLAILRKELDRRAGHEQTSIIADLPQILADERGASRGSFPAQDPNLTFQPSRRVSKILDDDVLARLADLSDDEVRTHINELDECETEVSATRRKLLDVVDILNHEIARRYQSGEANPSDVLTGR
jgi:hypothetical protein